MLRRRLLALTLLLTGCAGGDTAGPPDLYLGADLCDQCRMIVSEERHAAAALHPENGEAFLFDDLGCLLAFHRERSLEEWDVWVHDESSRWIAAAEGHYLRLPDRTTPMGSGWHALSAEAAAHTEEKLDWRGFLSADG